MAPQLLFDIAGLDLDSVVFDAHAIEKVNPHRGAMRLLDAVVHLSEDQSRLVAYHDVRDDEFWVTGHIPGQPIFPGVMMIETAAQLASFCYLRRTPGEGFMAFVGLDDVKFRGQVVPGDRFYVLCQEIDFRRRRCICHAQGLVNGQIVFEAVITGMPVAVNPAEAGKQ